MTLFSAQTLKPKLQNEKGLWSVEYTITLLTFITLFVFLFDLTLVVVQRHQATQFLHDTVRILEVQGGISTRLPTNFAGTNNTYVTSGELDDYIDDMTTRTDMSPNKTVVKILNATLLDNRVVGQTFSDRTQLQLKHHTTFQVSMTYEFEWPLVSAIIPGVSKQTTTLTATGLTSYQHDYDNWG